MRCAAESQGSLEGAALAKGLAVSALGKLAQREQTWEEVTPDYNDPLWGEWWGPSRDGSITRYRALAGTTSRLVHTGLHSGAVPQIPIWIWSAGRCWLWRRIRACGLSSVLYADTDGLVVTGEGYARLCSAGLIRDNEWGELRTVAGPVDCEVMGPKCVRIGNRLVQAGAPTAQRSAERPSDGYWFRQPLMEDGDGWREGEWVEEKRCREKRNGQK